MSKNNININTNQNPYFDDYDEDKSFHQVLYKPSLPVQARELTTQQSILRNQIKRFGDHIFKNGSKVTGGELVLNTDYSYVKLKAVYNSVDIEPSTFVGKTIQGTQSGTKALVLGFSDIDSLTGDPDTLYLKYITGEATSNSVQGIRVVLGGSGYTEAPTVTLSGGGTGQDATAEAVISGGSVIGINITNKGILYTSAPTVTITGGNGLGATAEATILTQPQFLGGERIVATDGSVAAEVVDTTPTNIHTINITNGGSGYTAAPTVTIAAPETGTTAEAIANITAGVVTSVVLTVSGNGYTTVPSITVSQPPAGGVTAAMAAELATPAGIGSSVSIEEGVFYINGNFISVPKQTLVLEKYFDTPSYKIGLTVKEMVVDSGEDSTLLDNAQGSSNFAAPGADRLKLELILGKKNLDSEDDQDFFEILRVDKGIKQKDIKIPIYSTLEDTFARRTFDESGSYTVRAFNIQIKDHPSDGTKFVPRLDPGKAFIEGFEFETIISSDLEAERARTFVNVNNFDRLMQYGNFVITNDYSGLYDIQSQEEVDLHNVTHSSLTLTNPTTYANTKIGTAKVRNIDYISGTGTSQLISLYLYDVKMLSNKFADVESIVVPVDSSATPVVVRACSNIDDSSKEGGTSGGDAKLFETSDNTLVFKLPQDTIKTIRDKDGNIDTSYTAKRVFKNVTFTGGIATLSTSGGNETFLGTGVLSDTNKRENYTTTVNSVGTSGFALRELIAFDGSGQSITVNAPTNTSVTLDANTNTTFVADVIATINIDTKQEKTKSLVSNHVKSFSTPNTNPSEYDNLSVADAYKINGVFMSADVNTDAVLPTLNVNSTADSFLPGETITGIVTGATGTVIEGAANTTTVTYILTSGAVGFNDSENITGNQTGFTKTISGKVDGDEDIKDRYNLDTGQRDNFYDWGRLQLKSGSTAPTGRISVVFDYFTHSGVGYLSTDSYVAAIGFDNIPTYTSSITGRVVELRDCIDFRPRRQDGGDNLENVELPVPNTNWSADYSYYLPRIDTVYLSRERKFGVNKGVPSLSPQAPSRIDGTMNLYTLEIPAYTFKSRDVKVQYIENKRYTMRDIGALESRINNLEYYTSLTLLEQETNNLTIKDGAGLDRFKNGLLIDGFNGHSVGNVLSPDYKCAIDFDEHTLRPSFQSGITDIVFDESSSTGVTKHGDLVTLPYITKPLVDQKIASKAVNVNPFAVLAWIGTVDLTPPSDNWIDTSTRPEVLVNLEGENDAWESLVGLSFGTQFNDWQTQGSGRTRVTGSRTFTERGGPGGRIRRVTEETVTTEFNQTRTGIRNEITGTDAVRTEIGDRIVDVSIVPFIRSRDVTITVRGMKPNTRVYPFFDGESVGAHCQPSGGNKGDSIFTDDAGSITGLVFTIPNNDTLRFRTGERQFLLCDNTSGDLVTAATYGEVTYQAQGLLQTKENVVVSTRVPRVQSFGMGSATEFRTTTNSFNRVNVGGWFDPLAETFLVDATLYPDGIFLSDVDLFFKSKDNDGLPVSVQIRDTLNGYPASTILPFSDVSLLPDQINISEDASASTKFTFPSLVYLQPGEYAVVVLSNSLKYECWIAENGDNIIGTDRKISAQPYAGVLFKSQNASTWTAEQNQDLTFVLNMAEFSSSVNAEAVFKNESGGSEVLADVIQIVPQEVKMNNTGILWSVKMTDAGSNILDTEYTNVIMNENYSLPSQKKITANAGSYVARAQYASINKHISPMIDTARNSVITIANNINDLSTNEENAFGGDAIARYITRRVTLKDGFDATGINVFMNANRQSGTSIKVYYKVLSQFDTDIFEDRTWTLMKEKTNSTAVSASEDLNEFLQLQFVPNNADEKTEYVSNSVTYDSYKTFAVKIVMNSAQTTKVPLIKDLRVVALA